MPIEYDFIAGLANPVTAAIFTLIALAALTHITYRWPTHNDENSERLYLRKISLLAEVLVSVGLIGLITFAGRSKLDSMAYERAEQTRTSERYLSEQFSKLAQTYCIKASNWNPPTNSNAAIQDACELWGEYNPIYRNDLDWLYAQSKFKEISEIKSIPPNLKVQLIEVAQGIGNMFAARQNEAVLPVQKKIIMSDVSWGFILFCAAMASIGVSLKCSRAARELRQQRQVTK